VADAERLLALARDVLDIEADAVRALKQKLGEAFLRAHELIMRTKGRVVVTGMGKSGHIGNKIAATLASTGTPAFFMHPAEASHGDLGMITPEDVVIAISYSGESDEIARILPLIKRRGAKVIAITGREGSTLGSLALFWRTPGYEPTPQRVGAVEQIAVTCIPAIENARRYREARQMAETDALTGFFNQRYFHETLRREALRAQRYDRRLALLILDLDDFKTVNDRIGHLAGDAVLAQVAERLRNEIRSVDVGCRIGGDEFAVIMPESTTEDATQLFQRMQDAVATMTTPGGGRVRISAGIAELHHGETAAGLFERADSALYRAKELGKDRASLATD